MNEPPIVSRRSKIQGRGVFATRDIAEAERVVEYTGKRITPDEADSTSPDDATPPHLFLHGRRRPRDRRLVGRERLAVHQPLVRPELRDHHLAAPGLR